MLVGKLGSFSETPVSGRVIWTYMQIVFEFIHDGTCVWVILLMEEILHQLIGSLSYRVLCIPGGAGLLTSTVANKSNFNSCYLHVLFCILIPSRELYRQQILSNSLDHAVSQVKVFISKTWNAVSSTEPKYRDDDMSSLSSSECN